MTAAEVVALAVCETQTQGTGYAAAFMPEGTAAIRALEAAGFRVVPEVATEKMFEAGAAAEDQVMATERNAHGGKPDTTQVHAAIYAAMLAAAGGPRDE